MCLALIDATGLSAGRLLIFTNRDEFHRRPTAPLARWEPGPTSILAGRDLEAGGTWLGVSRGTDGRVRFGLVTNYRDPSLPQEASRSRGQIVPEFLGSDLAPLAAVKRLRARASDFAGYNVVLGMQGPSLELAYHCNVTGEARALGPGFHALSNRTLDTEWPKTRRARSLYEAAARGGTPTPKALFAILADREIAPDGELPSTGVPLDWERRLSAIFIAGAEYGTRASTVLAVGPDETSLSERGFDAAGKVVSSERIVL